MEHKSGPGFALKIDAEQGIVDDTKAAISNMLLQAHQEGWAIPTMQQHLTTLFQQWMAGNVPAEDFEWYRQRLPPHRTENIVRTETIPIPAFSIARIGRGGKR